MDATVMKLISEIEASATRGQQDAAFKRKLRLFLCACCNLISELVPSVARAAVKASEQYADRPSQELRAKLLAAHKDVQSAWRKLDKKVIDVADALRAAYFASSADIADEQVNGAIDSAERATKASGARCNAQAQARLWEEITAHTFSDRHLKLEPQKVALAKDVAAAIHDDYSNNNYEKMLPKLAEALRQAGCDNDDILNHCKKREGHVRGCWAVDLVLGKN